MRLDIKAHGSQDDVDRTSITRLRRVISVLQDAGFDVELEFTNDNTGSHEPSNRLPGGKYPHAGNLIQLAKHYKDGFNYGSST